MTMTDEKMALLELIEKSADTDLIREMLGVATGASEAEVFWKGFLRSLADRGLRGVKLVIADDHKGLRAAASKVFHASLQRCRVHWMRSALAHVPAKQRPAVVAMLKTIFAQETAADARSQWNSVADALRERAPKLAELMDNAREDVLAYTAFPREHWPQIASTNPLERLNGEIKRRTDVVGIFPNAAAIVRLAGALMLEQNDEWAVSRRYMSLESLAVLSDAPRVRQPCASAAKLRGGGPSLTHGVEAIILVGRPPPRTVIGCPRYRGGRRIRFPAPTRPPSQ